MPGFFDKLFDFNFREYVTPSIVKFIFWVAIILIGLSILANIVMSFMQGFGVGFVALILSPIVGLLFVILTRVYLEVVMVLFRIMGLLQGIAASKGVNIDAGGPAMAPTAPAAPAAPPVPPVE